MNKDCKAIACHNRHNCQLYNRTVEPLDFKLIIPKRNIQRDNYCQSYKPILKDLQANRF
jgi:hypothetical protein